jgi:hypothetical protein
MSNFYTPLHLLYSVYRLGFNYLLDYWIVPNGKLR